MKKMVLLVCVLWLTTVMLPVFLLRNQTDEPISEAEMAENGTEVSLDETTSVASEILQDTTVTVNVMVAGQEVSYAWMSICQVFRRPRCLLPFQRRR